jgi:threonine/homoserine/homoserine lactone efflux protein
MLLQIAIGPVCLFIFKTAAESGILAAETGVLAAVFIDAVFVMLAIAGLGSLLEKPGLKLFLKYFGALTLLYFGLGIALSCFGIHIIPSFHHSKTTLAAPSAFVTCLILTASNPLTVIFWTGVFATKVAGEGYGKPEMIRFGTGAVLATLFFLGLVALVTGMFHWLIPDKIITYLNGIVGVVLAGFGVRMGLKKDSGTSKPQSYAIHNDCK